MSEYFIGGAFPALRGCKGGATASLYQNGCYDEQRNEHNDTNRYACSGIEGRNKRLLPLKQ